MDEKKEENRKSGNRLLLSVLGSHAYLNFASGKKHKTEL